jgi:hypothetical protein
MGYEPIPELKKDRIRQPCAMTFDEWGTEELEYVIPSLPDSIHAFELIEQAARTIQCRLEKKGVSRHC